MKTRSLKSILLIQIAFISITINAQTWQPVGNPGFSAGFSPYNSIAMDANGTPYVAYPDWAASYKATVMKFDGTDWIEVGNTGFTANKVSSKISMTLNSAGMPYVAFADDTSMKATVMKFDGVNWQLVGNSEFTGDTALSISLAIDPNNSTPYVAYIDRATDKAMVKKFDGISWQIVGSSTGVSIDTANSTSIAINSAGTPYVAFVDQGNASKVTVMKFDGTNWQAVGVSGSASIGAAFGSVLKLSSTGTPYVAFRDWTNIGKITVRKFNGSNWQAVGSAGFSINASSFIDSKLAIDPNGVPYVSYHDGSTSQAVVMKYSSGTWQTVGGYATPGWMLYHLDMAISNNGIPYIVFCDYDNSSKTTVRKFDGTTGINDVNSPSTFAVYPNPANNTFTIETSKKSTLTVQNSLGQVVMKQNFEEGNHIISTEGFSNGIYQLNVQSNNKMRTQKLVVNH